MKKGITITIIFGIVIIIFTLFNIYQKNDNTFEKEIQCKELGEQAHKEQIAEKASERLYLEPQYIYNKKLDTCLYSIEYVTVAKFRPDLENDIITKYIKDLLQNKKIYSFTKFANENNAEIEIREAEYNKIKKDLFSQ